MADSSAALEEAQQLERDNDFRELLSTPAGRRFVWRLMTSVCEVFGDSFNVDPLIHARNAGKRAVGLSVMKEAQRVAPKQYLEMTRERINNELRELAKATAPQDRETESSQS